MNDKLTYFSPKVQNRLRLMKNRIWAHLPVEKISLWGRGSVPSKDVFIGTLREMLGTFSAEMLKSASEEEQKTILTCADHALRHEFSHLGSGFVKVEPLMWNSDLRTGFQWPERLYYSHLRGCTPKGSDIKSPWELSRCPHFLWLAGAYLLTNDERYAREVVDELNHWIDHNPLMYTVNWTCSMEVAIRAVNWLYALNMIADSPALDEDTVAKVHASLYQHGFFIFNNLERTIPYSNNHYYSDIIGLLYLGRLLNPKWYKFALKEYVKETLIQFLPSGVDYEKSVSYHRLMTELGLYPYFMLKRVGESLPQAVAERLSHALDYVKLYTQPNGNAPLVADNDDGRLLPFVPRDLRKHDYLNDDNSLEIKMAACGTETLASRIKVPESRLFQEAKTAILRQGKNYLMITSADRWRLDGNTDTYVGTHLHNDLLSFVYAVDEEEIICDSGSHVYTSDIDSHVEFRRTSKHNTVVVDDEEQHLRENPRAFMMKYNATAKPLILTSEKCIGEYTTHQGKMTHRREFVWRENVLALVDELTKKGSNHTARFYFHLAPGIAPQIEGNAVVFATRTSNFTLSFDKNVKISILDDTVSPSFGVLQNSKTIVCALHFDEAAQLTTTLTQKALQNR